MSKYVIKDQYNWIEIVDKTNGDYQEMFAPKKEITFNIVGDELLFLNDGVTNQFRNVQASEFEDEAGTAYTGVTLKAYLVKETGKSSAGNSTASPTIENHQYILNTLPTIANADATKIYILSQSTDTTNFPNGHWVVENNTWVQKAIWDNNSQTSSTLPLTTKDVAGNALQANTIYSFSANGWEIADALFETKSTGVITIGFNNKSGDVNGFTGLVKGDLYYINEGGGITNNTSTFQAGSVVRLLGQAKNATTLMFVSDSTYIVL